MLLSFTPRYRDVNIPSISTAPSEVAVVVVVWGGSFDKTMRGTCLNRKSKKEEVSASEAAGPPGNARHPKYSILLACRQCERFLYISMCTHTNTPVINIPCGLFLCSFKTHGPVQRWSPSDPAVEYS